MRTKLLLLFFALGEITASAQTDSLPNITKASNGKLIDAIQIHEVVVTGTRNETDIRHLPMTISVIDRKQIEQSMQPSILPILTQQVPGLFITARGIMGYGVSGGAAGGMSLRGIGSGSGRLMVLIDGHPQYMGLMGHPIADAYQSLMAERVEVLRGPASVLYGSNAMGGRYQHRYPPIARGGNKNQPQLRIRFVQHFTERSHEPHSKRRIYQPDKRFVQPNRRTSPKYGIRAIRGICQTGL